MIHLSRSEFGVLFCRLTVGVLFVLAGLEKIAGTEAFAASIGNYHLVSPSAGMLVATILPWAELFSGIGLVIGIWTRGSAFLISLFLAVFTFAVLSAMARHLDIACGCFTQDPQAGHVGWQKVIENMFLFGASLVILFAKTTHTLIDGVRAGISRKQFPNNH